MKRLSDIKLAGHDVLGGFHADLLEDGVLTSGVWVQAVLERTAVIVPADGQPKRLVGQAKLMVDPRVIDQQAREKFRPFREGIKQPAPALARIDAILGEVA